MSVINPPQQQIATKNESPPPPAKSTVLPIDSLKLTQSSPELTAQLQTVSQKASKLDASYLFVELDSGKYAELGADRVLAAASTIKLPILIALFQDVDEHKVQLQEQLTIDQKSIAQGSGDLQDSKPGTQVSVFVAATKMMTISDNTATNLLIERLGGKSALNQRFRQWGLKITTINDRLPDLAGTNVTTASELARALSAIARGNIVSANSRTQILRMMSNVERNTMLPKGLGKGAKIAHKTGDIGSTIADVGLIEQPSGKSYIASVLVNRPHNDPAGPELVRTLSKIADRYFRQPQSAPSSAAQSPISPAPGLSKTVSSEKN